MIQVKSVHMDSGPVLTDDDQWLTAPAPSCDHDGEVRPAGASTPD